MQIQSFYFFGIFIKINDIQQINVKKLPIIHIYLFLYLFKANAKNKYEATSIIPYIAVITLNPKPIESGVIEETLYKE